MHFTIRTYYYDHKGNVLRTVAAAHPNSAMESALRRMALNLYAATTAQVVDTETGEVHGEVVLRKNGKIEVTYVRDPRAHEHRINLDEWQRQYDERNTR